MVIRREQANIRELLSELTTFHGKAASDKSLQMDVEISPEVPDQICVDSDRLRQILNNLIGNALKFTDKGRIAVSIGYDLTEGLLEIAVEDTGPGIPPRSKVFSFSGSPRWTAAPPGLMAGPGWVFPSADSWWT